MAERHDELLGLLHAVQGLEPEQRERAVAGYRLLGLDLRPQIRKVQSCRHYQGE